MRYPRYSVRNASALVWLPLKMCGRDPMGLMYQAWGMGTWFWRPAPLGSLSEGSLPLSLGSLLSRGPSLWHQRHLWKALTRVAQIHTSLGSEVPSQLAPKGMGPPDPLDSSGGWESCWAISCWVAPSVSILAIVSVAIDSPNCVWWVEYVAGVMVGVMSRP